MELQKKLNYIQQNIKVGKSRTNKFANYTYRNCEDILHAVKPLLDGCNLKLSDQIKILGEHIYVEATAELILGEETIKTTASAFVDLHRKGMSAEQRVGSASSYARKYCLSGLFLLDDAQDPDELKSSPEAVTEVSDKINIDNLLEDL